MLSNEDTYTMDRASMVAEQLIPRDITDVGVLEAMGRIPRHRFVPVGQQREAYDDHPLPIGNDQTISQPYIVAFMSQVLSLEADDRVLEIGTGSGYQTALLGELVRQVYSIEIVRGLGDEARVTLEALGLKNIHFCVGDGYAGWPEEAPFDKIMLTAAPAEVPLPLLEQMAIGGLLVAPIGERRQELVLIRRLERGWERRSLLGVRFVPMTGRAEER